METRRRFLLRAARATALLGAAGVIASGRDWLSCLGAFAPVGSASAADDKALAALARQAPVARFWTAAAGRGVRCLLCARTCLIPDGERGVCRTRLNLGGTLHSLVYGRPIAFHVDPIEKKPFYHFLPGKTAFSLATAGCPLHCRFCQNWEISQSRPEDYEAEATPPGRIAALARENQAPVIAFTYNEPTVFTEYLIDIAREARESGIRSVMVSCGYMNEAPLTEMCAALAAIKIDLKGFDPAFYRDVCDARLDPVLRSVRQIAKSGVHLELVNLVVPTLNDGEDSLNGLVRWVAAELGPDVPLHFTRFHPDYRLQNLPATPVATLEHARELALAGGLHYVYVGNVPGHPGNQTYCPGCGQIVIRRQGFFIVEMDVVDGRCRSCGHEIKGVWS